MEVPTNEKAIASNRDAWNDSARHHKDTAEWQARLIAVGQADFSCLDETLTAVLKARQLAKAAFSASMDLPNDPAVRRDQFQGHE